MAFDAAIEITPSPVDFISSDGPLATLPGVFAADSTEITPNNQIDFISDSYTTALYGGLFEPCLEITPANEISFCTDFVGIDIAGGLFSTVRPLVDITKKQAMPGDDCFELVYETTRRPRIHVSPRRGRTPLRSLFWFTEV